MTRYLRVRETLSSEIAEGIYPVGERFPTDLELCARFSVSRHTVREALRDLQQEGVLQRQRRWGTTVVAAPKPPPYVQTLDSLKELDTYWRDAHFDCSSESVITARQAMAEQLDCLEGSRWMRFAGARYRKDDPDPLCWTEIYLSEALLPHRAALRLEDGPFFDRVRRVGGIAADEVEQQVRAIAISAGHAELLKCEEGSPGLLVRRRYFAASDKPFEITLSVHPGDRYVSLSRLSRRPYLAAVDPVSGRK